MSDTSKGWETGRLKVGIFGGTFDPPHVGHLVVADQVRTLTAIDEVWFVVANDPWQKSDRAVSSAAVRLELTELAVGDADGFVVSDVELEEGGPSYTIDTLTTLRSRLPDYEWSLIVGADAAAGLDTWERAEELAAMVDVIVVNRPGVDGRPPEGWRWQAVDIPSLEISSTDLRKSVAARHSIRFLTPDAVIAAIDRHGLYRGEQ